MAPQNASDEQEEDETGYREMDHDARSFRRRGQGPTRPPVHPTNVHPPCPIQIGALGSRTLVLKPSERAEDRRICPVQSCAAASARVHSALAARSVLMLRDWQLGASERFALRTDTQNGIAEKMKRHCLAASRGLLLSAVSIAAVIAGCASGESNTRRPGDGRQRWDR